MDFYGFDFEEFIKACQNNQNNTDDNNCDDSTTNNTNNTCNNDNCQTNNCNDIPGGFQDLNPQVFIIMGELLGNVLSGKLPFNVQNALGNWLQLVGQTILTFNAQQQYLQAGPGRYYNWCNKNVNNPFCPTSSSQTSNSNSSSNTSQATTSNANSSNQSSKTTNYEKEINDLKESIEYLKSEIQQLKNK